MLPRVSHQGCFIGFATAAALVFGVFHAWPTSAPKLAADSPPAQTFPPGAVKPNLPKDFQPYVATIPESKLTFTMVPIPGGKFTMGSPEGEEGREPNEGPQMQVEVSPFWMASCEVTWDEYDTFCFSYDVKNAKRAKEAGSPLKRTVEDVKADGVTRPTPPYVDMTFGNGHDRFPASCMTQLAASQYCKWLSAKTGIEYRLPTEAEWEYACRAGAKTKYFFGDDDSKLDEYAWHSGNAKEKPHPVGTKKPNPWGLYDMHGGVREWCQDIYREDYHKRFGTGKVVVNPLLDTKESVWHTARGGSWVDDKTWCRCSSRVGSEEDWSVQDPQLPKSKWWHTDAQFVGFRVVRSYKPSAASAVK